MDFFTAYHFLSKHPMFAGRFSQGLEVDVVKVNPETNCIDDDSTKNAKTQVWLECGPYINNPPDNIHWCHDIDLDCGGDTYEEAIVALARLVKKHYGESAKW